MGVAGSGGGRGWGHVREAAGAGDFWILSSTICTFSVVSCHLSVYFFLSGPLQNRDGT